MLFPEETLYGTLAVTGDTHQHHALHCRVFPVVHSIVGYSLRDFTVEGMLVPANEKILCCLWGTLHDPKVFEDPEK